MEPYVVCQVCGEKTRTSFTYCTKCGSELYLVEKTNQSSRDPFVQPSTRAKINDEIARNQRLETCPECGYKLILFQNKEKCTYCGFPHQPFPQFSEQTKWAQIDGEVTSISVKKFHDAERTAYWRVHLIISYSVAGQTYTKKMKTLRRIAKGRILPLFGGHTHEEMMAEADSKYPLGTKIPLFYNQNKPSKTKPLKGEEVCFIATAAFESPLNPKLDVLRSFRNKKLKKSKLGALIVQFYYRLSPPLANTVARSNVNRSIVRLLLKPVILLLERKGY